MRQRHLFGLELAVRSHGQYRIETRDWALEQLRAVRRLNRHAREERPAPDPRRVPRPEHSGLPRRVGFGLAGQVRRQAHVAKVQGLWSRDVLGGCGRTRSDRQEWNGHSTSWRREVFGPHWSGQVAHSGRRRSFSAGASDPTAAWLLSQKALIPYRIGPRCMYALSERADPSVEPCARRDRPMSWVFRQSTGELRHNGVLVGTGYSGKGWAPGSGRNNPLLQGLGETGPIPAGSYNIGVAYPHPNLGSMTMNLTPVGHNALGRTLFRIHGDNSVNNASHGCVVLSPTIRTQIVTTNDRLLIVVP
jgi:predicted Fe-S protein YdhL (DUF1289 family)